MQKGLSFGGLNFGGLIGSLAVNTISIVMLKFSPSKPQLDNKKNAKGAKFERGGGAWHQATEILFYFFKDIDTQPKLGIGSFVKISFNFSQKKVNFECF